MENASDRLKALRVKAGLEPENLADQIGINAIWYDDLENGEVDMDDTLDLDQIRKLSLLLGVGMSHLVVGHPLPPGVKPLSFLELARHLKRKLAEGVDTEAGAGNMSGAADYQANLDALEETVGWSLDAFLKSPNMEGWGQRMPFFKDVCGSQYLDWMGILAYCEGAENPAGPA